MHGCAGQCIGRWSLRNHGTCRRENAVFFCPSQTTKWRTHSHTDPSTTHFISPQGVTFSPPSYLPAASLEPPCRCISHPPLGKQQLFPIELLLLPSLLAFNKAGGYQRVKEKLPRLCRGPDCTIGAVREALYKRRARRRGSVAEKGKGGVRWRLPSPPPDKSALAGSRRSAQPGSRSSGGNSVVQGRYLAKASSSPGCCCCCCPCQGLFVYP